MTPLFWWERKECYYIWEYPHQPCSKSICRQFRQRKQKYFTCGPWICTERTPASLLSYWSTFGYFLKENLRLLKSVHFSKKTICRTETTLDLASEKQFSGHQEFKSQDALHCCSRSCSEPLMCHHGCNFHLVINSQIHLKEKNLIE